MYSRILAPQDGSDFAEQALPHAIEMARRFQAELHLLEVIPPPNPAVFSGDMEAGMGVAVEVLEEAQEALIAQAKERLQALAERITAGGVPTVWKVIEGDPVREIVAYESSQQIDLVTMASHGRTGLLRAFLGSVTDAVLRQGGRPVLVVRAGEA